MAIVSTALAKIHVFIGGNCEQFLKDSRLYDPLAVGTFCEAAGLPELACIAYEKGRCYKELVAVTNLYSMFKQQARCLLKWSLPGLWAQLFMPDNVNRDQLIDQIITIALHECTDPSGITVLAEALENAKLLLKLIELLDTLLLTPSAVSGDANLETLLMRTVICADRSRVSKYVAALKNYDFDNIHAFMLVHDLVETS